MLKFGDAWKDDTKGKEGVSPSGSPRASPSAQVLSVAKAQTFTPPAWSNTAVLGGVVLVFILTAVVIFANSGTQKTGGSAHSIVLVFEGFKGTVFNTIVLNSNKAPNLNQLLTTTGAQNAACLSPQDARCATTQSGPRLGDGFSWSSGPGLASILSGVNADKHLVNNDSLSAYKKYSMTAASYPSFLKVATTAGLRTVVVGSSHFLDSVRADTGACDQLGVLDFECDTDFMMKCLQSSTCNTAQRTTIPVPTSPAVDYSGGLSQLQTVFDNDGADIVVVHLPQLSVVASTIGAFSDTNLQYVAAIYLVDAYVGQVLAMLESRVNRVHETWLVVGTSDHGGYGSTYGSTMGEDEIVPFFVTTMVAGGNLVLNPLTAPTKQYDVAPTILSWHDLLTPALAASMDGTVQAICSGGKTPKNCGASTPSSGSSSGKTA